MFDRFIGLPYLDKGRDRSGCDCWGLVCLVFRELCGVELPSYSDQYVTAGDRAAIDRLIAGELDEWHAIDKGAERPFDCVLMREGRFVRHVGVVAAPGLVLHTEQGATSRIERYRFGLLANRVVSFQRLKS